MKKLSLLFMLLLAISVQAQKVNYTDYFTNNTLRFDYNRCGTADTETVYFAQMIKEGKWSGPRKTLIDPFAWGEYRV